MPPHDPLTAVAHDLGLLARDDRRAILSALAPADRDRVEAAMDDRRARAVLSAGSAANALHSGWVEQLADGEPHADSGPTAAALAALRDALAQPEVVPARGPGRSLLQAAGGLFGPAKAR